MKLTDANLEARAIPSSHYGFSATRIEDLGSPKYTLVQLVVDTSGSTGNFRTEMEACIKSVIQACKYSPQADNLMVRLTSFDNQVQEVHGFKLLEKCNLDDYTGSLPPGGMTALFDACINGIDALTIYGQDLIKNDYEANGLIVVITDGMDNMSKQSMSAVKNSLANTVQQEKLESCISILIAVNLAEAGAAQALADFNKEVGFTQFIDMGEANVKKLAKLADFISKSISSQSKSLGTGSASQPLTI